MTKQDDADIAAIRRTSDEWLAALRGKDAPRLLGMLTDDVVLMAPGLPVVHGKDAARALYSELFRQFERIEQSVVVDEIVIAGDWAFSWGSESIVLVPAGDASRLALSGQGMSVLRRQPDGTWKFARGINNAVSVRAASSMR